MDCDHEKEGGGIMKSSIGLVLCLPVLMAAIAPVEACNTRVVWQADLSGDELAPPVKTPAKGVAVYHFNLGHPDATIDVDLQGIKDVTAIDLRAGDPEKAGPVVYSLYAATDGKLPAHFVKKIAERDLRRQPDLKIGSFTDLTFAVLNGTAYVTISTKANPSGELRGKVWMHKYLSYSAAETDARHDEKLHEQAKQESDKAGKDTAPAAETPAAPSK
jgi:hypothetical protein